MRPPSFWNLEGSRRKSTSSETSSLASSQPATSAKLTWLAFSSSIFARDLPKENAPPRPPPCICRMKKTHTPINSSIGNQEMKMLISTDCSFLLLRCDLHAVLHEVAHHPQVVGRRDRILLALVGGDVEVASLDLDPFDAAVLRFFHELGVADGFGRLTPRLELLEDDEQDECDHHPDRGFGQHVVQGMSPARRMARGVPGDEDRTILVARGA